MKTIVLLATMTVGVAACGAARDDEPKNDGASKPFGAKATSAPSNDAQNLEKLKRGAIVLHARHFPETGPHSSAGAWFESGPTSLNPQKCATRQEGSCTFSDCTIEYLGGEPSPPPASAGAITIKGTRIVPGIRLEPGPDNRYSSWSDSQLSWFGGEKIQIQAEGADAPAIDVSMTAPSIVDISSPTWTDEEGLRLNRSRDFELAWTHEGEASGDTTVRIHQQEVNWPIVRNKLVSCEFPVGGGQGRIPPSMLQSLDGPHEPWLSVERRPMEVVRTNEWHIEVSLNTYATRAKRTGYATARITFE